MHFCPIMEVLDQNYCFKDFIRVVQVLTSFVTDQRLKDCLLQTVCYLTPLTEVYIHQI